MSEGNIPQSDGPKERRKHGRLQPLGELLRTVLKESGVGKDPAYRRVLAAWSKAAGADIAAQTKVASVKRGVVTIEVDSAPLLHELAAYLKRDLLAVLRKTADAPVSDLRFRLRGDVRPPR